MMFVINAATEPANDTWPNEDFCASSPHGAVLLDGAGTAGVETGCRHGVAWFAQQLGTAIHQRMADSATPLPDVLAHAIEHVATMHSGTCDLNHPGTPSATVLILRESPETVEHLVLADSTLILVDAIGTIEAITDDREAPVGRRYRSTMDALANGTPGHDQARREYVQNILAHRNSPGGFWVAAANPDAAQHAITGTRSRSEIAEAALLSDGATRLVDRFHLASWDDTLATLRKSNGPAELIRQVRAAEASDLSGQRWPRSKTFDDATAVYLR